MERIYFEKKSFSGAVRIIGRQLEKGFTNIFLSTLELEFSSTEMVVERGRSSENQGLRLFRLSIRLFSGGYKYSSKDKQILETGK